jgi:hypothetical protein
MSRSRFFRKIITEDRELNQLQTNVDEAIAPFIRSPILDGRLIENVALINGTTAVEHKLGRQILGYIIVAQDASASIYNSALSDKFVTLVSNANVNVKLWVF